MVWRLFLSNELSEKKAIYFESSEELDQTCEPLDGSHWKDTEMIVRGVVVASWIESDVVRNTQKIGLGVGAVTLLSLTIRRIEDIAKHCEIAAILLSCFYI